MQDNTSVSGNTAKNGGGVNGTLTIQDNASVSGNTANNGGGVYVDGDLTMQGGTVSGNTASWGGGVYVSGTFTKSGGTVYGSNETGADLRNATAGRGYAVYDGQNKRWRNAGIGPAMNQNSYGFWLNETAEFEFPIGSVGIWKRSNFNNTLTFTLTTVKSSSRDTLWTLSGVSGDSYVIIANNAAKTKLMLMLKHGKDYYGNEYIEISGDSGSGENNWNGVWRKQ